MTALRGTAAVRAAASVDEVFESSGVASVSSGVDAENGFHIGGKWTARIRRVTLFVVGAEVGCCGSDKHPFLVKPFASPVYRHMQCLHVAPRTVCVNCW